MKPAQLLRAILPDVLIDNFDIVNFDKSADRFDIYLDEKKVQLKEDKRLLFLFYMLKDSFRRTVWYWVTFWCHNWGFF